MAIVRDRFGDEIAKVVNGRVRVAWVDGSSMGPDEAREFADGLKAAATIAEAQSDAAGAPRLNGVRRLVSV